MAKVKQTKAVPYSSTTDLPLLHFMLLLNHDSSKNRRWDIASEVGGPYRTRSANPVKENILYINIAQTNRIKRWKRIPTKVRQKASKSSSCA